MAKTYQFTKEDMKRMLKDMSAPFLSTKEYFANLGARMDRDTTLVFRNEGAVYGRPKWTPFSPKTLKTRLGTWNIRYGTDKKPKRTARELRAYKTKNNLWFKPGPMKGYKSDRRYGPNSKLLQASGGFRRSFKVLSIGKLTMDYGTKMEEAEDIMDKPNRPVLMVTPAQEKSYQRMWRNFYLRKMSL
jgi:hypothetical protein